MLFLACLQYNVALPPAILSRFDLVHVMIDEPDDVLDYNVAQHIVKVHQLKEEAISPEFSTVQLQRYIAYARTLKPQVCWRHILALFSQM
jgi:DNA replication licensing factor MCM6